ncbi:MAG: RNA polymerase sigma factor [Eubacteriales bacterium]|nr:RNA polymerase sigma factor [Eubacteriales bacterium]
MNIEELYRTYFDIVYRYIRSVSRDESLAEEVTQETFFKALKKADQFREDCDVRVWLCQIAKNTLYDHLKKQKRQLLGDEKLEEAESADGELLEEKLAQRSQAMEIHKVLHRLSEPYKEVFSLRTFGELKFSEIGMLFGKSENWARVTYYRARVKIREELEYEDHM